MMNTSFRFSVHDHIATLSFDQPNSKVNTLGTDTLSELGELLDDIASQAGIEGLIFQSGKPDQCIAGADLREIAALMEGTPERLEALFDLGHAVFGRLESLPFPTVGIVDGPALGGGLELLLACDRLVAVDSPKARLGLPEVTLGLIPAWGGTQRLTRRVGLEPGLERLILGAPWNAKQALDAGLVAEVVDRAHVMEAAEQQLRALRAAATWHEERRRRAECVAVDSVELEASIARAGALIEKSYKPGDPAPRVVLDVASRGARVDLAEGLRIEKAASIALFQTSQARNRVFAFFIRQSAAKGLAGAAQTVERIGVVGGGTMGAGIAAAAVVRGIAVTLIEPAAAQCDRVRERVRAACERSGRGEPGSEMLSFASGSGALCDCRLVIEAVPEDQAIKRDVLAQLETVVAENAVIATNTSSFTIAALSGGLRVPERFGGLHFFNPVERMELVEVVRGAETSEQTENALFGFARMLGKVPIRAGDCAGFLVNRVLFAYLGEACHLLDEEHSLAGIDAAAVDFGMPMGPFRLMDWIGLDIALAIFHVLAQAYPDRMNVPEALKRLVAEGRLGRKTGAGFYDQDSKSEKAGDDERESGALADRLMLPLLLESVRALEEGVARGAGDLDLALLLGIGFPVARGGVLRWADELGAAEVVRRAEALAALGARFATPARLSALARAGGRFHAV